MIHGGGGAKQMERGKTKVTCKKLICMCVFLLLIQRCK